MRILLQPVQLWQAQAQTAACRALRHNICFSACAYFCNLSSYGRPKHRQLQAELWGIISVLAHAHTSATCPAASYPAQTAAGRALPAWRHNICFSACAYFCNLPSCDRPKHRQLQADLFQLEGIISVYVLAHTSAAWIPARDPRQAELFYLEDIIYIFAHKHTSGTCPTVAGPSTDRCRLSSSILKA